jgi:large subunit ribosomal protein L9
MKIILKEDIVGLGYKNDVVDVKPGYGRNYLIPTGKGVIASSSALKQLAENMKQQAHKIEAQKAAAQKRANQLEGVVVEVAARVSATGMLYGSVNTAIVAQELAKKGIEVDRKIITMRDIKTLGDFEAVVHFFKDVEVKLPVKVVAENPEELAKKVEKPVEQAPAEEAKEEETPAEVEEEEEAPAAE